jgi:hypothetical protein
MHLPPQVSLAPRHPHLYRRSTRFAPTGLAITADMSHRVPVMRCPERDEKSVVVTAVDSSFRNLEVMMSETSTVSIAAAGRAGPLADGSFPSSVTTPAK